jgi:ATP-dependent RNA helicase
MASGSKRRVIEGELLDDLANVEFETSDNVQILKTFDSMGLKDDLVRGIYAYGKSCLLDTCTISVFS